MTFRVDRARVLRETVILLLVISAAIITVRTVVKRWRHPSREPTRNWIGHSNFATPDFVGRCGPGEKNPDLTVVTSIDKTAWVVLAAEAYMHACDTTRVRVLYRQDIEALEAFERGDLHADVWLPSDSMFGSILEERWTLEGREPLHRAAPLLQSPMVLLIWADQLEEVQAQWPKLAASPRLMSELLCPGLPVVAGERPALARAGLTSTRAPETDTQAPETETETSPTLPLPPPVELDTRYSSPTHTAAGQSVLLAGMYGYLVRAGTDPVDTQSFEHALEQAGELGEWLKKCEGVGLAELDGRELARRMYLHGGEGVDAVLVREHIAFEYLQQDEELRVVYPRFSYIADHPPVVFPGEQSDVGLRFVEFLASERMQLEALGLGLRPARLERALLDYGRQAATSPLVQAVRFGVPLTLDTTIVEPPRLSGDTAQNVLHTWMDATREY